MKNESEKQNNEDNECKKMKEGSIQQVELFSGNDNTRLGRVSKK